MRFVFAALGVVCFLWGFVLAGLAKSAIHEIQAYVMYLIAAVLWVGAAVIQAVGRLAKTLRSIESNTFRLPKD